MPVLSTACPQCERPIELDLVHDQPSIACPCCDRQIAVPRPGLRTVPATVWIAAVLTVLLPASIVPGLLLYLPSEWYALPAVVPVALLAVVAGALLLSRRWAWIVALVLGITALSIGVMVGFLGLPFAFASGSFMDWVISAGSVVVVSGSLVTFLLLTACRRWCDR